MNVYLAKKELSKNKKTAKFNKRKSNYKKISTYQPVCTFPNKISNAVKSIIKNKIYRNKS